jgi:protein TonB
VPVQIVAAGAEPTSAATPPPQPVVIVRAIARAQPKAAVRSVAASVTSDQAGSAPSFSAEDQASYEEDLYNHIAKYIRYPRAALHVCPSGTARLRFQSSRQGQLLSIVVEQSSGCAVIDNEAIETVRRAQPLPAIPAALSERMTVRMPLSFGKS